MIVLVLVVRLHLLIVNLVQLDFIYWDLLVFLTVEMVNLETVLVDLEYVQHVVLDVKPVLIQLLNV